MQLKSTYELCKEEKHMLPHKHDNTLLQYVVLKDIKDTTSGKILACYAYPIKESIAIVTDTYLVEGKCHYDVVLLDRNLKGITLEELVALSETIDVVAHEAYVLKLFAAHTQDKWLKRRYTKQFKERCEYLRRIKPQEELERSLLP